MFILHSDPTFLKNYAKLIRKNSQVVKLVEKTMARLKLDPKYPSLKSHQINHPKYGKVWSSWVHDDLRTLWIFQDEQVVILVFDVGDHDHVY